ncbi:MAG: 16S rRNA (adenine(1518)-N(6)/adenine(1519)-N(6))-dimethyltransferase RsmA [Lachnospiraceae bacterium]|nr:16S rRNA (adenine(1518)-N(6)/adenine(1519)-N(6))-dimethyltransferase RsmA [Lachnospiraceae bacterium]
MDKLAKASNTIDIIKKYNFTFQKRYGQNFLVDTHVMDKIMDAAQITHDDHVIEIGPGIGSMTQYLCERAGRVTAVEIDKDLIPVLNETLKDYDNVRIINEDILKLDLNKLILEENNGKPAKVVANLPYYITTPIIMGLLEGHVPVSRITVMVQKEVADRMQAGPGSKDYGALSLAVNYYSSPHIAANVPPNCFIPRPNVGSAVINLDVYDKPKVKVGDEEHMFKLIRAAFNQRRKTLTNSVSGALTLDYSKHDITEALEALSLSGNVRGEALTLEQFALLSDRLLSDRNNLD